MLMLGARRLTAAWLLTFGLVAFADDAGAGTDTPASKAGEAPRKVDPIDAQTLAGRIDKWITAKLQAEKLQVGTRASDAEFIRRVWLDLAGVIPPGEEVAAFLDSTDKDKRAKLIDELLASPRYGRRQADVWLDLLLTRNTDNRRLQVEPLSGWLERHFNDNQPWNELVVELLTASGPQSENPATTFFLANPTPDKMNDVSTRVFLGVQLQCAQCHDHPFTGWKQDEYWAMAGFFAKVRVSNVNKTVRNGGTLGVQEENGGRLPRLPESAKRVPLKFLQGERPVVESDKPYRPVLAKWMTSAENPFFARAFVNRTWAMLFGRGFTNPIDDMHEDNVCSHPELLREMSEQFVANGFDVKYLLRAICLSETYQRSSRPVPSASEDQDAKLFARMSVKQLTSEQLFDSVERVMGRADRERRDRQQQRGPAGNAREQFVTFFRADEGADPTEYQHGIPQVLRLMNSSAMNRDSQLVGEILKEKLPPDQAVERLFLATIARRPTSAEREKFTAHVKKKSDPRLAYNDVVWALLNSSAFALNP